MEQREEAEMVEEDRFEMTLGQKCIAMMVGGCLSLYPLLWILTVAADTKRFFLVVPTGLSVLVYIVFMIWKTTKMVEDWHATNKQNNRGRGW